MTAPSTRTGSRGFTLAELVLVLALVSILAAIAAPVVTTSVKRAEESALKEDLLMLRKALDDHYADRGRYPVELHQLVELRYLRKIPDDPVFKGPWKLVYRETGSTEIADVKSQSDELSIEGTAYASW